jgi:hypothetical protein
VRGEGSNRKDGRRTVHPMHWPQDARSCTAHHHITTPFPDPPQTHYAAQPQSHLTPTGTKNTRHLALHDVGRTAEGDAFAEEDSHKRKAVVDGIVTENVLHRVLYPQVHVNGVKKKKKK